MAYIRTIVVYIDSLKKENEKKVKNLKTPKGE